MCPLSSHSTAVGSCGPGESTIGWPPEPIRCVMQSGEQQAAAADSGRGNDEGYRYLQCQAVLCCVCGGLTWRV
jgi:hypothetical protein